MARERLSDTGRNLAGTQTLGADERAIISHVGIAPLRRVFSSLWRFKIRLQFTGWLQYIPSAVVTAGTFLLALLLHLLGSPAGSSRVAIAATAFLAISAFDLVTVKFRLRFPEPLPRRRDGLEPFDLMRARRSCRSFQTRKLTPADLEELLGYVRRHSQEPTLGRSPIRFEYISAPLTVWPTVNATEFLVAIAPKQYDRLAVIDVGRSLQRIVIDATRMGLGTCWIGPGADQTSVAKDLGARFDPEKDHIICVCAVGYASRYIPMFLRVFNLQFRRRLPLSALFFADRTFQHPLDTKAPPFNRFGRTFEVCQWSPSSYNGQTTRCVALDEAEPDLQMAKRGSNGKWVRFDFYADTESRYYAPVALGIWVSDWEMGCAALGIHGHASVLSPEQRGLPGVEQVPGTPRYDVSWLADEAL
jgi:nitroreductase